MALARHYRGLGDIPVAQGKSHVQRVMSGSIGTTAYELLPLTGDANGPWEITVRTVKPPAQRLLVGKLFPSGAYKEISLANGAAGQRLFKHRERGGQFVLDATGQKVQRFVTRIISDRDVESLNSNEGISPRNPELQDIKENEPGYVSPKDHVLGGEDGRASPYTSVTKQRDGDITARDGRTGLKPFDRSRGMKSIDLFKISPSQIFDVSSPEGQETWSFNKGTREPDVRAREDAIRTKEVLIKGKIPQAAISDLS